MEQETLSLTKSEIETEVDKAINFLSQKFYIKEHQKPKNLKISIVPLGQHVYGESSYFRYWRSELRFDIEKFLLNFKEGITSPRAYQDLIIGEEVAHLIYANAISNINLVLQSVFYRNLEFVNETIAHYAALIYANRNQNTPKCLELICPDDDGIRRKEAYKLSEDIFIKHGDSKLLEISSIKDLLAAEVKINQLAQ